MIVEYHRYSYGPLDDSRVPKVWLGGQNMIVEYHRYSYGPLDDSRVPKVWLGGQ